MSALLANLNPFNSANPLIADNPVAASVFAPNQGAAAGGNSNLLTPNVNASSHPACVVSGASKDRALILSSCGPEVREGASCDREATGGGSKPRRESGRRDGKDLRARAGVAPGPHDSIRDATPDPAPSFLSAANGAALAGVALTGTPADFSDALRINSIPHHAIQNRNRFEPDMDALYNEIVNGHPRDLDLDPPPLFLRKLSKSFLRALFNHTGTPCDYSSSPSQRHS